MSGDGKKKHVFDKVVGVKDLSSPEREGWLTKQGGAYKSWKKRWFVLKGDTLYYFKTKSDTAQTGEIKLAKDVTSREEKEKSKKGKFYFSVGTPGRKYLIFADSEDSMKGWIERINRSIQGGNGSGATSSTGPSGGSTPGSSGAATPSTPVTKPDTPSTPVVEEPRVPEPQHDTTRRVDSPSTGGSPRAQISKAKEVIPFLQDEDSKVLEFWQIWSESIPPRDELQPGLTIEYHVSTSANMQKLTWRTAGPQNIFIQKMVDFFWNVGAPESEIDRLNDVGALINPIKIGSWIDMSAKGGMDGGWYFPVDIQVSMAIEAADPGEPSKKVSEWATKNNVTKAWSVGRDMGAAPPRQTEIRVSLPGTSRSRQIEIGIDAFSSFGFPPLNDNALAILSEGDENDAGLSLSVITSSEGFVRLGLMTPRPSKDIVQRLCGIVGANPDDLFEFQGALGSSGPAYVEYQFLKEGFGYGVYREGFDIVFHYDVGSEGADE